MHPTTPDSITQQISELCAELSPDEVPIYLDVTPIHGANVSDCYPNVLAKIKADGGSIVYGWQIWASDIALDCEFHAVWKSPNGELIDITPKPDGEIKILFLVDSARKWTGSLIDNVRYPLTDSEFNKDMERVCARVIFLRRKAEAAAGAIKGEDFAKLSWLEHLKPLLGDAIRNGDSKKSPCRCGSSKMYKNCCGARLLKT